MSSQLLVFLTACVLGATLGMLYDGIRIFRQAIPHNYFFIGIEDFLFFLVVAIKSFRFMIGVLDGRIRYFIVIGEILGWILYFFTLSIVIMGISQQVIRVICAILRVVFEYLMRPIFSLVFGVIGLLFSPFMKLFSLTKTKLGQKGGRMKAKMKTLKNPLKSQCELLYNKMKRKAKKSRR